ncbi:uncharacterized protein [Amphiura filiformis]|uniref:uncharacterized protein n=1 Tax=Amphiura filiformis TaxID=82378 RepID=UPI003B20CB07
MAVLLAIIISLLGGGTIVSGVHFQGGTVKWVPLGNDRVEVTYLFSFNGFRGFPDDDSVRPGDHSKCGGIGRYQKTRGYLKCGDGDVNGCAPEGDHCTNCLEYNSEDTNQDQPRMRWQCTDYDIKGGFDIGSKTYTMKVPETKKMMVYYKTKAWVDLVNVNPHDGRGWKVFAEIDLNQERNGVPNSSPISSPIPVQLYHKGCDFWFEIPVTDPDNDKYRCRNSKYDDTECYRENARQGQSVCGKLNHIHVYENCTLHFDTHGPAGNYAVRVVIEDLDENDQPKSRVSLSFLLNVSPNSKTCDKPRIVAPGKSCTTIPVNEQYEMTIVAEAATAELPIDRIDTNKPHGMSSSTLRNVDGYPLRKSKTLKWTPRTEQIGTTVGFGAVDSGGFSSDWSSVSLNVVDFPALSPSAEDSYPSKGERVGSPKSWSVAFNRPIRRPSQTAYISLISQDGRVVAQVNSADPLQVEFGTSDISFDMLPINDFPGVKTYTLHISSGVAIDAEYDDANCGFASTPAEWKVTIDEHIVGTAHPTEVLPPATKPPVEPPFFKCEPGDVDIPTPPGAEDGDKCFIHLKKTSFTVTSANSINVPYKVCCPTTCKSYN